MKIFQLTLGLAFCIASVSVQCAEQVTDYAKSTGFKNCISTVTDVENFFAKGENYGSWVFVAKENPNEQLLNSTLEITFGDGTQLVDFTVIPLKDGTCSYTYTRTWYMEKSCMATSKEEFMSKATYRNEINKNVMAFEDGGAKILLTQAGLGCMVQKKEIGFRHKKQGS